jgi:hypothetical protein
MMDATKVFFHLEQDDDDYPPVSAESVWAVPTVSPGEYIIANVPFFERAATLGDTVKTRSEDGVPWFEAVVQRSSNSLVRAVFFDEEQAERVSQHLLSLGCAVEYSKAFKLLAVNVPGDVKVMDVQLYLGSEAASGTLDYEEPILRHSI